MIAGAQYPLRRNNCDHAS